MRALPLLVLAGLALAGCGSNATLMRFKTAPTAMPRSQPPILRVSSAPGEAGDALTVKALPERAAAAYVEAMAPRTEGAKGLREALAEPIKRPGGGIDRTSLSRVITVSVQRPLVRPGDRYLMTIVDLKTAGAFTFTGFQSAATEYNTINIGTVSISNQTATKAEIDPKFGSDLIGTGAFSISSTRTDSANRTVAERGQLSVLVPPDGLSILRTGAETIDLTGNTLVKLTVQLDPNDAWKLQIAAPKLFDKDGKLQEPDKASVELTTAFLPPPRDLYVCGSITYQDRVIDVGAEYLDEGRQQVSLRDGVVPWTPYLLVPASDLAPPIWEIMTPNGALAIDTGVKTQVLHFTDYETAETLRAYLALKAKPTIGGKVLSEGDALIALHNFADLHVERYRIPPPHAPIDPKTICAALPAPGGVVPAPVATGTAVGATTTSPAAGPASN